MNISKKEELTAHVGSLEFALSLNAKLNPDSVKSD